MPRTFVWHRTRGPKKTEKLEGPAGEVAKKLVERLKNEVRVL